MPDQNKGSDSQSRFEKIAKSVLESDHPVFGKIKKELPASGIRQEKYHPAIELLLLWNERFNLLPKVFTAVVAIILSFFIYRQITDPYLDYRLGDIAQRHLIAQKTVEMVDEETTEAKVKTAVDAVLSVYDYDRRIFFQTTERIRKAFAALRKDHLAVLSLSEKKGAQLADIEKTEVYLEAKKTFSRALDIEITDSQFESILRLKFSRKIERILVHLLSKINLNLIVSNKELLASEQGRGIALNRINDGNEATSGSKSDFGRACKRRSLC